MATAGAARAAYRHALRASVLTFVDDAVVKTAFRNKLRTEFLDPSRSESEAEYLDKINLVREMGDVLRQNIVQAKQLDDGIYKLRFTNSTELGNNEDIKKPKVSKNTVESNIARMHYSALKRAHQSRQVPILKEEDLEESFVRGSGPGGQSVNKTQNNVQLLHKPTGIRVSCQETRSLQQNRKIARENLLERIDKLQNPGLSRENLRRAKVVERERRKRKKRKKREQERLSESEAGGKSSLED